ncbi:unnamed protein product [Lampetra planeri]
MLAVSAVMSRCTGTGSPLGRFRLKNCPSKVSGVAAPPAATTPGQWGRPEAQHQQQTQQQNQQQQQQQQQQPQQQKQQQQQQPQQQQPEQQQQQQQQQKQQQQQQPQQPEQQQQQPQQEQQQEQQQQQPQQRQPTQQQQQQPQQDERQDRRERQIISHDPPGAEPGGDAQAPGDDSAGFTAAAEVREQQKQQQASPPLQQQQQASPPLQQQQQAPPPRQQQQTPTDSADVAIGRLALVTSVADIPLFRVLGLVSRRRDVIHTSSGGWAGGKARAGGE